MPSIDVDAFTATYLNQGVALTFDLQNLIRSSVVASEYSMYVFIKIIHATHVTSW